MAESGTSDISVIQTEPRGIIRFGVFELDLETQQLRKSGIRVRLQAKSCQVLEALLEKPGKIVSRDDAAHLPAVPARAARQAVRGGRGVVADRVARRPVP